MKFFESGRLLRTLLVLSVLFFLSSTIGFFYGNFDKAMGFLAAGFVAFALSSVFGEGIFRQLAFTIWIAAGVAVGFAFHESFLIFPGWVPGLGELEMSIIFIPVLQVIMFAMGTTLSVFDFFGRSRTLPNNAS